MGTRCFPRCYDGPPMLATVVAAMLRPVPTPYSASRQSSGSSPDLAGSAHLPERHTTLRGTKQSWAGACGENVHLWYHDDGQRHVGDRRRWRG